jgi:glucosamine--fructose-6-phosphate aminotransferase (isomerizing)
MCGISGYIGRKRAEPILIKSLSRLEYRGYDSCGIAVRGSPIKVHKDKLRIKELEQGLPTLRGTVGIGHTRWATHGEPSQTNAHPHTDCSGKIAVVHNGIIDNFRSLRSQLSSEGHNFLSETDSEIIPHLIEKYYHGDLEHAVETALAEITGSYAILVVAEYEHKLIAARRGSPLIIGVDEGQYFAASDVPAVLNYTDKIIYLEDDDMAIITSDNIRIINNGVEVERQPKTTPWRLDSIQKSGYEHFMLKEIHEQPRIVRESLKNFLNSGSVLTKSGPVLNHDTRDITIMACGTSYHAGLIGKYIIEEWLGLPVRVEIASEISHRREIMPTSVMIGITQSGETADILTALKRMKRISVKTVAISNVPDSSVCRLADEMILTNAGPEIGVAATKTFIAQLMVLYQMALSYPGVNTVIRSRLLSELMKLPAKVQQLIKQQTTIVDLANYLSSFERMFFISRGINIPTVMEGSLKMKEIAYIHSEGYAAGELKHGPFALLDISTPVVAIIMHDDNYSSMMSSIKEIKARKSPIITLTEEGDDEIEEVSDYVVTLPSTHNLFSPVINSIALQLLAYHTAKARGCPIDFPRNLAKSVTVE